MILGSEEEAREVIAKLEGGEDFATLATELSQHTASKEDGGELGWLNPEEVYSGVEDFVFSAEPGEVSEPIPDEVVVTTGGYWLVEVLAVEDDRELAAEDRDFLKNKALSEWISALWDDPENEVESFLDADKKSWAIERVS
jgi:parvulin-like peptidyl-prolyl isomerase